MGKYINPFTDFGFKKLFGEEANKDLLIDFLNALLGEKDNIISITYLKTEQLGRQEIDRKAIFDLYCENDKGEKMIIEMQKGKQSFFKDRALYYSTFAIQSQAKKNSKKNNFVWNYELQKVYSVAVLDFTFDENSEIKKVKHDIMLKNIEDNTIFYDKLQFIFLEMPHFTKQLKDLKNHYEKWLYLLKNLPKLDKIPQEFKEKIFMKVFEKSDTSFYSDEELSAYQSSLKTYTDYQNTIDTAFMEGEIKGKMEGKEEGRVEGKEVGRVEEKEIVTVNALKKGFDYETIRYLTGLSFAEIDKIKNKYNL